MTNGARSLLWFVRAAKFGVLGALLGVVVAAIAVRVSGDSDAPTTPDTRPILLKGKDGTVYKLPAENEQKAIARGYTYLSQDEAREWQAKGEAEARTERTRNQLSAVATGAALGALLGVPQLIMSAWFLLLVMLGQVAGAVRRPNDGDGA